MMSTLTDEVDDDGDLEGRGRLHVGVREVGGVGEAGLGGVAQTVSVVSDRTPGPVCLAFSGRVNWKIFELETFAERY